MGVCDLRAGHNTNTYYGGNIGYGVFKPFRGHHYSGKACKLLFGLAQKHNMEYLIIMCHPDNIASRKTCEFVGAKLQQIIDFPENNEIHQHSEKSKCQYKIDLNNLAK